MCHSSTHPCTSLHVTQFYTALVLQATNAGVRRPGYEASSDISDAILIAMVKDLSLQFRDKANSIGGVAGYV